VALMVAKVVVPKTEIPALVNEDVVAAPHDRVPAVVIAPELTIFNDWKDAIPEPLMVALRVGPAPNFTVPVNVEAPFAVKVDTVAAPLTIKLANVPFPAASMLACAAVPKVLIPPTVSEPSPPNPVPAVIAPK